MVKTNDYTFGTLQFAGISFLLLLFAILTSSPLAGQPVLGASNTSLGGGGTAYLSGFEATFWNPANLMIKNRRGSLHIGVGHTGILYEPVLSSDAAEDQFFNFTDSFYPYEVGTADINADQREAILTDNYPRKSLLSQHQTRTDLILGGALWQRENEAFSVVLRARLASRIDVGRGWYSNEFVSSGGRFVREFTLNQQKKQLYEFAVGYAREFTFINGLLPRLSKFYVGIAPKIVLAGPGMDATYNARYIKADEESPAVFASDFFLHSTGEYTGMMNDYLASGNSQQAISNNLNRKFEFNNTGYGLGFDFGLTYLIPLGDELPTLKTGSEQAVVSKSLRFGFSINDIGVVRYNKTPLSLSSPKDTVQIDQQPPMETMFIGADGQYLSYFSEAMTFSNTILNAQNVNRDSYSKLLPTSMNAGVLFELSQLKLMGDLTLGLNNTAFTTTKLAIHLGLEARPIQQLPLRIGTRLASGLPTHVGLGAGIETDHWDLTLGSQVILRSQTLTSEFVGGAFAGIQLHF
jgi:hypothetical protein